MNNKCSIKRCVLVTFVAIFAICLCAINAGVLTVNAHANEETDNNANDSHNIAINADWETKAEGETIEVEIGGVTKTFTYGTDAFSQLANGVAVAQPDANIYVFGNGDAGVTETTSGEGTEFSVAGTYNISGNEWANLGYVQLNPSKDESSTRYTVNINDSKLELTKPQLRRRADLNITNSHTDFWRASPASSGYLFVFRDSSVNIKNSVVGFNTDQGNSSDVVAGQTTDKHNGYMSSYISGTLNAEGSTVFTFGGDTKDEALSVYDRGLASFKDSVLYCSYINVGKYQEDREDRATEGRDDEIATIKLDNTKVFLNSNEATGMKVGDKKDGELQILNGSLLDYTGIITTISSNGTISMDATSSLKVGTISNNGKILVDMTNAQKGIVKLIDSSNSGSNYGSYDFAEGKDNGYYFQEIDGDLYAIKGDIQKTFAVNTQWAGTGAWTEVAAGFYFGFNAFASVEEATAAFTDDTEKLLAYGSAASLGDLVVSKDFSLSTTDTDTNDASFASITIKSSKTLTIIDGSKINIASAANNGTAKVTGNVKLSCSSWTGNLEVNDATLTTSGFTQNSTNDAYVNILGSSAIKGYNFNKVYVAYGQQSTTDDILNVDKTSPSFTAKSMTNNGHIIVDLTGATEASINLIQASETSNYGDYKLKEGTQANYSLSVVNNTLVAESKITPKVEDLTYNAPAAPWVYDGNVKQASFVGKEGMGEITPMYATSISASESEWSEAAPKDAGTYYVMAKIDAGTIYRSAKLTSENWKFTITPVPLAVTPDAKQSKVYDGKTAENITYSYSGQVTGETPGFSGELALDGGATSVSVGSYKIVQNTLVLTDKNYTMHFTEDVKYTINRKGVTVSANDISKTYGDKDPELKATVDGLVGTDTITYTISRADGENVGVYLIEAKGDNEQGNYFVTYVAGILDINPVGGAYFEVNKDDLSNVKASFEKLYPDKAITVCMEISKDFISKEDIEKIQILAGEKKLQNYNVNLIVKADGVEIKDAGSVNTVAVSVAYNFDYQDKADFQCFRVHNGGEAEEVSPLASSLEHVSFDEQAGIATIKAVKYSTYSIAYSDVVAPTPIPNGDTQSFSSSTGDISINYIFAVSFALAVAAFAIAYSCKKVL